MDFFKRTLDFSTVRKACRRMSLRDCFVLHVAVARQVEIFVRRLQSKLPVKAKAKFPKGKIQELVTKGEAEFVLQDQMGLLQRSDLIEGSLDQAQQVAESVSRVWEPFGIRLTSVNYWKTGGGTIIARFKLQGKLRLE